MKDYLERANQLMVDSAETLMSVNKKDYVPGDYAILQTLHSVLELLAAHTLLLRHIIDILPEEEE